MLGVVVAAAVEAPAAGDGAGHPVVVVVDGDGGDCGYDCDYDCESDDFGCDYDCGHDCDCDDLNDVDGGVGGRQPLSGSRCMWPMRAVVVVVVVAAAAAAAVVGY